SFEEINGKITEITDQFVSTATDIRKELVDWFELPSKIREHVDSTIRSVMKLENLVQILLSLLWVLVFLLCIKFVLEVIA
ncbi:hypothetical protein PENTCL1PPCAC_7477, partial [Pristionchus entomophagus]